MNCPVCGYPRHLRASVFTPQGMQAMGMDKEDLIAIDNAVITEQIRRGAVKGGY